MTAPYCCTTCEREPWPALRIGPELDAALAQVAKAARQLGNDIVITVHPDGRVYVRGEHRMIVGYAWHLQADVDPDSEGTPRPSAALKRGPR